MFLAWAAGPGAGLAQGDTLSISFTLAASEHVLQANVARVLVAGVGVAFSEVDPAVLAAIEAHALAHKQAQLAADQGAPRDFDSDDVIAGIKAITKKHIGAQLKSYFSRLDEFLFLCARDAPNNIEQRGFFDFQLIIKKNAESLQTEIQHGVIEAFDRIGEPLNTETQTDDSAKSSLSLVDEHEFEDFLTVADIVSRAEPRYKEQLYALERRLSFLISRVVDRSGNPVGPSSVCQAFSDGLHRLELAPGQSKVTYEVLEDIVIPALGTLYDELNDQLIKSGVLPTVESVTEVQAPRRARRPGQVDRTDTASSEAADSAKEQNFDNQPDADSGGNPYPQGMPPAAGQNAGFAGNYPQGMPPAAGQNARFAGNYPQMPPAAGVQQYAGSPADGQHPGAAAMPPQPGYPPAGVAMAPAAPPAMPQTPAMADAVAPTPVAGGGHGAFGIAQTLLGLQRQMGVAGSGQSAALAATGAPAFSQQDVVNAMSMLDREDAGPWGAESQGEDFRHRLQAVLGSQGGEAGKKLGARESDAIDMVAGVLDSLNADEEFPEQAKPLINKLRTTLYKLAVVDDEFLGDSAHPARQVVNEMAQHQAKAQGSPRQVEVERALDQVAERISQQFDAKPQVFSDALSEMQVLASEHAAEYEKNLTDFVAECEAQQALIKSRHKDGDRRSPAKEVATEWAIWLNRAKQLKTGDELSIKRGKKFRHFTLGWIGEDYNPFVFIDRNAKKAASMTLQELAMQLRRGSAIPLASDGLPAMDRAQNSALFKMHDQIGHQALQDPLTGLLNRKKFITKLEQAILDDVHEGSEHVLVSVLFDGIGEVISKAGKSACDSLIKKLANLIAKRVEGEATLARLGDDEFGLLFDGVGVDKAEQTAQALERTTGKLRVRWKDERFSLPASVGLVAISAAAENCLASTISFGRDN